MDLRHTVQSIFVLLTLLTEYLVAFDLGIFVVSLNRADINRDALGQVVLPTLLYSSLEPAAYAFANSITEMKFLPLLMSVFATLAVTSTLIGWALTSLPHQPQLPRAGLAETRQEERTSTSPYSSAGRTLHLITTLALTVCAATVNAALRLCALYFDTTHSQAWLVRFPFGWYMVGLLCLFAFFAAKTCSLIVLWAVALPRSQEPFRGVELRGSDHSHHHRHHHH